LETNTRDISKMKVYVGYDTREDIAYQVCEHSIKRRNGQIEVIPLKQKDLREKGIYYNRSRNRFWKKLRT